MNQIVGRLTFKRIVLNALLNALKFVLACTTFGTVVAILGKPIWLWLCWLWNLY